ncbi:hypothetical protein Ppa06_01780 [Planomonospora parontospora subsp. parontospora]|uniref:Cas12f1-like TNB domain-containing protein n=2 Tax=Planomonospora parontospora TaxID=58119 RepID=A0AA37BB53_9ACTN|nr:hypothetical protein GCM10010126_01790 [Planomonospora parontospora]GII06380.1 hypothetical protein Ppa06_01780 [Planomonospora parontospora subsp. parontospora]
MYNDALRARRQAHANGLPYVSDGDLSKRVITAAKRTPERSWLGEVSAVVLQQALADLNTAYRNFFASLTGKRKGPKAVPPRYRSRKDRRQAIRFTKNARFSVTAGGKLRLPKIGDVPVRWSRNLPAEPSSVTVIKDAAGRYFASFVAEARRDFAHKLSTRLIRENQAVYVEDLCVNGLARTKLAKSVHDAGWSQFTAMLTYKAARHGRHLGKIDRWFPSSKMCGSCGVVAESLPLNVRSWSCPCGAVHDRDVNAARNILAAGRADRLNACGDQVRPGSAPAQVGEAGSLRGAA